MIIPIVASFWLAFGFPMTLSFHLIRSVTYGFSEFGRSDQFVLTCDSRKSIDKLGRLELILVTFRFGWVSMKDSVHGCGAASFILT